MNESGVPGYEMGSWFGLLAPAKTPKALVDRIARETNKAVNDPRFGDRMKAQGLQVVGIKMLKITPELAETRYEPHKGKGFYAGLVTFMTSSPVLVGMQAPR